MISTSMKYAKKSSSAKTILRYSLCALLLTGLLSWSISVTVLWLRATHSENLPLDNRAVVECHVTIIGTGFAGSYAAYSLAPILGDRLCIVEKLNRDGGRILDVANKPGGPVFGVGALRVTSTQATMLQLAKDLQIELQLADIDNELLKVRGSYFLRGVSSNVSESSVMCKKVFKLDKCDYPGEDTDKAMLRLILEAAAKDPSLMDAYPDFPTYIMSILGDEGLAFVRESVRYNSFISSMSTRGILAYFRTELDGKGMDPLRFYPKGGMSEFVTRMLKVAENSGARFYRGQAVLEINSDTEIPEAPIFIKTPKFVFTTDKLLSSIDPFAFQYVDGNVADRIKAAHELQMIEPQVVAIVTTWWPRRWWLESKFSQLANLSRAVSHQNCFNVMEIPTFPSGINQNVTRAVYDDGACVDMWRTLAGDISADRTMAFKVCDKDELASAVVDSLSKMFHDINIPQPRAIHGFIHENGWHFQRSQSNLTNEQIFDWSFRPIANKNIALIGEAYNLNYAGWCTAALKSTMHVLAKYYNFTYPCLGDEGSPAKCNERSRRSERAKGFKFSWNNLLP